MSEREITHVIPDDGFDHEPSNCVCRPQIFESASMASDMDLLDSVEANPGDLTFMHQRLGEPNGRFKFAKETDVVESESAASHEAPEPETQT